MAFRQWCVLCRSFLLLLGSLTMCLHSVHCWDRALLQSNGLEGQCDELTVGAQECYDVSRYCNAKGRPVCCEQVNLLIQRSLADVVDSSGRLLDAQGAKSVACYTFLEYQLSTFQVHNTPSLLAECNITAATFAAINSAAVQQCGSQLRNWATVAELADVQVPGAVSFAATASLCGGNLNRSDVEERNPKSCGGVACEAAMQDLGAALARQGGPLATSAVCTNLVRSVVPALVKEFEGSQSVAGAALTRCLWDPSLTVKCTYLNFATVDFTAPYEACSLAMPVDPAAQGAAVEQCANAISGVALQAFVQAVSKDGLLVPPALQVDSCRRTLWSALSYHGMTERRTPLFARAVKLLPDLFDYSGDHAAMCICGAFTSPVEMRGLRVIDDLRRKCAFDKASKSCPSNAACRAALSPISNPVWLSMEDSSDIQSQGGWCCSRLGLVTWLATDYGSDLPTLMQAINCVLNLGGKFQLLPNFTYLASSQSGFPPDYQALLEEPRVGTSPGASSRGGNEKRVWLVVVLVVGCSGAVLLLALGGLAAWALRQRLLLQAKVNAREAASSSARLKISDPGGLKKMEEGALAGLGGSLGWSSGGQPGTSGGGLSASTPLNCCDFSLPHLGRFSLLDLRDATGGFDAENLLGEGGFGRVYVAQWTNGQQLAVKRWLPGFQGESEFLNEVQVLGRLKHENVIPLLGFCCEGGERLLVYPFMARGSLKTVLHGTSVYLGWLQRLTIAMGVSMGLEYLHYTASPRVLHRDVKASNVLLDERLVAKIADFGLAKDALGDDDHVLTDVRGTAAYIDPHYLKTHKLSEKSDVFSFGVLLLELLTGRRPIDHSRNTDTMNMLAWARALFEKGAFTELVDPRLSRSDLVGSTLEDFCRLAFACVEYSGEGRPTMRVVRQKLDSLIQDILEDSLSELERVASQALVENDCSSNII